MHTSQHRPFQNHLLAALPVHEFKRLEGNLELMRLPLGLVLYEAGCAPGSVYFPTTALVSLLHVLEDGASAEIAIVGNDGILGISVFMGGEPTPDRAVVLSEGWSYRISARHLKTEFERGGPATMLLLRYVQVLMTQITQTAVCNRHHGIDQQFCRWLLMCLDRTDINTLTMTNDLIADMLGVGLEGLKDTIGKLQSAGYIRYSRGRIIPIDRPGLENQVCECYAVVKRESERLLLDIEPRDPKGALGKSVPY
jgi:CRP-like cAMP-binding protein